jgi:hypothetical protein
MRTQLEDLMGGAVPRLCMTFVDFNLDYRYTPAQASDVSVD